MSSIEKLLIRGIRSYDPNSSNVIEFYSPLTLITIIECLKYATTGDMPPNSKGGAFIYDPKVARESEVKAQIKLKFKSVVGRQMVCTRSLQVTQTKSKITSKKTENMLHAKDPDSGESVTMLNKCADLDQDIPLHLGVTRAILDNVIFCHQEDANWPLSEPSVLKKKFDDIFASTKYTKAIEHINSIRKDQRAEMAVDKNELEHLETDKERAKNVRISIGQTEQQRQEYKQTIEKFDIEIEQAEIRLIELKDQMDGISATEIEIVRLESSIQDDLRRMDNVSADMELMQESTEELEEMRLNMQEKLDSQQEQHDSLQRRIDLVTGRLQGYRKDLSDQQGEIAAQKYAEETHAKQLEARNEDIKTLSRQYQISGFISANLSQEKSSQFFEALDTYYLEQQASLHAMQQRHRIEREKLIDRETQLKSSIEVSEREKRSQTNRKNIAVREIADLSTRLNTLKASSEGFEQIKDEYNHSAAALEEEEERVQQRQLPHKISENIDKLTRVDTHLSDLQSEIAKASSVSNILAIRRREYDEKERQLKQLTEKVQSPFEELTGDKCDSKWVKSRLDEAISRKQREVDFAKSTVNDIDKELSALRSRLSVSEDQCTKKTAEVEQVQSHLSELCGERSLPEVLKDVVQELQDAREQYSTIDSTKLLYTKYKTKAGADKKCPLCTRKFAKNDELEEFLRKIDNLMSLAPQQLKQLQADIDGLQGQEDILRERKVDWDRLIRLRDTEIPALQIDVESLHRELQNAENNLKKNEEEAHNLSDQLTRLTSLTTNASSIAHLVDDMRTIDRDIKEMAAEASDGIGLDLDAYNQEIERLKSEKAALSTEGRKLRDENEVVQRQLEHAREKHKSLQQQYKQHEDEINQIAKVQEEIEAQKRTQVDADKQIEIAEKESRGLKQQLSSLTEEKAEILSRLTSEQDNFAAEVDAIAQARRTYEIRENDINSYISEGKGLLLERSVAKLEDLIAKIEKAETELNQHVRELVNHDNTLHDLQRQLRNIKDNLEARRFQANVQDCRKKIEISKKKMALMNKESVAAKLQESQRVHNQLQQQRFTLAGELTGLENQIRNYEQQLKTDFKDIEDRHRQQLIKLKTSQMAHDDLERYSKALQGAIIAYHTRKMEEINRIIQELWVNTYQGNDIDRIEIRSDAEGKTASQTHNYRVVMIKGDTVLDMRGRCSAGQKVLASIIIRLALAESFCLNCGMLALDEPTTNLDRANIESLAMSLADIIKSRKAQSNFQLIIITHDEEFLSLIGRSEFCDYYYRVSKDPSQNSIIERQAIADV